MSRCKPVLVVCPSSLRWNWASELERWLPDLEPRDLHLIDSCDDLAATLRPLWLRVLGQDQLGRAIAASPTAAQGQHPQLQIPSFVIVSYSMLAHWMGHLTEQLAERGAVEGRRFLTRLEYTREQQQQRQRQHSKRQTAKTAPVPSPKPVPSFASQLLADAEAEEEGDGEEDGAARSAPAAPPTGGAQLARERFRSRAGRRYTSWRIAPAHRIVASALATAFGTLVVDEAHHMHNMRQLRTKVLVAAAHAVDRVLLLTGTPCLARPLQLFPLLHAVRPRLFPDLHEFGLRYCAGHQVTEERRYGRGEPVVRWIYPGGSNLAELHAVLAGCCLVRRRKRDVLRQLPPKTRQCVVLPLPEGGLGAVRREMRSALRRRREEVGAASSLSAAERGRLAGQITGSKRRARARKAAPGQLRRDSDGSDCSSDWDAELLSSDDEDSDEPGENAEQGRLDASDDDDDEPVGGSADRKCGKSSKRLHRLLRELATAEVKRPLVVRHVLGVLRALATEADTSAKIVIFGHHRFMLDALEEALSCGDGGSGDRTTLRLGRDRRGSAAATHSTDPDALLAPSHWTRGREFVRLDGSCPPEERAAAVHAFQHTPACRVAVVSTRAGGQGIDLTAAQTAIFTELDPIPGVLLQAEDRIHRLRRSGGPPAPVLVQYLVARGTADDTMWARFLAGAERISSAVDGHAAGMRATVVDMGRRTRSASAASSAAATGRVPRQPLPCTAAPSTAPLAATGVCPPGTASGVAELPAAPASSPVAARSPDGSQGPVAHPATPASSPVAAPSPDGSQGSVAHPTTPAPSAGRSQRPGPPSVASIGGGASQSLNGSGLRGLDDAFVLDESTDSALQLNPSPSSPQDPPHVPTPLQAPRRTASAAGSSQTPQAAAGSAAAAAAGSAAAVLPTQLPSITLPWAAVRVAVNKHTRSAHIYDCSGRHLRAAFPLDPDGVAGSDPSPQRHELAATATGFSGPPCLQPDARGGCLLHILAGALRRQRAAASAAESPAAAATATRTSASPAAASPPPAETEDALAAAASQLHECCHCFLRLGALVRPGWKLLRLTVADQLADRSVSCPVSLPFDQAASALTSPQGESTVRYGSTLDGAVALSQVSASAHAIHCAHCRKLVPIKELAKVDLFQTLRRGSGEEAGSAAAGAGVPAAGVRRTLVVPHCSVECVKAYRTQRSGAQIRRQLGRIEHGVCQMCGLNARSLFQKLQRAGHSKLQATQRRLRRALRRHAEAQALVNGSPPTGKAARITADTVAELQRLAIASLDAEREQRAVEEEVIEARLALLRRADWWPRKTPRGLRTFVSNMQLKEGHFWEADHLVPVVEGGGLAGISNFRTLCIVCHQKVTKELTARLVAVRKRRRLEAASGSTRAITEHFRLAKALAPANPNAGVPGAAAARPRAAGLALLGGAKAAAGGPDVVDLTASQTRRLHAFFGHVDLCDSSDDEDNEVAPGATG